MMPLREAAPAALDPPVPQPIPCAYQDCPRAAACYPVVQLPPPALARNGQPLRVVFRRSPVCDAHRHLMVYALEPRLRESLDAYCGRHCLPVADWGAARWEWAAVEGA
jgi:hypothetical protein